MQGNTLTELAAQLSIDGSALEQTVAVFNESCKKGVDPEFGRAKEFMGPIDTPPYYALPHWPTIVSVSGGPKHDKESRVLDNNGKPIPRLYAVGELGSFISWLYEAGAGIAEYHCVRADRRGKRPPLKKQ